MYFNQFSRKLSEEVTGVAVARQLRSNGHLIEMTTNQVVTIDGIETQFSTIDEAREFIRQEYYADNLEHEIAQDIYEELSDEKVAQIIAEHHDVKVTDTLIESYVELASSNIFSIDPVVTKIRDLNKFDNLIEGKVDFTLNDGSVVAINKDTQLHINNILEHYNEIVEHMRESKENFLSVIQQIKE